MSLADEIKVKITEAMKSRDEVAKDILRLALGEIQTIESRAGSISEEDAQKAVRKIVTSNEETMAVSDEPTAAKLKQENEILLALLPQMWGVEEIAIYLNDNDEAREAVQAAGNDGQATGVAMRFLKQAGAPVNGKDVGAAVKAVRS